MNEQFEFVDRYSAMGIPFPDPETMCLGSCEGVGFHPTKNQENPLWQEAHNALDAHTDDGGKCDGWHFVTCSECGGTGKRSGAENAVSNL